MPILGKRPKKTKHAVVLSNGEVFLLATLLDIENDLAYLETNASFVPGPHRAFPLFPEHDGLYELQGQLKPSKDNIAVLDLK